MTCTMSAHGRMGVNKKLGVEPYITALMVCATPLLPPTRYTHICVQRPPMKAAIIPTTSIKTKKSTKKSSPIKGPIAAIKGGIDVPGMLAIILVITGKNVAK